jgi:hypothetical protein
MRTMIDEIFDRHYQPGRAELNAAILRGIGRIGSTFDHAFGVLNRIEYSAPWTPLSKRARSH